MTLKTINPATDQVLAEYPLNSMAEAESKLSQLVSGFESWRKVPIDHRAGSLTRLGQQLRENALEAAHLMATEVGKPLHEGLAEVEKCALACDYFASNGKQFLASETIPTEAAKSYVCFEPLGPILAIMPWNFPFWQVFRFAAPALMAGNTVLLKHAANATGCGLMIERLVLAAGFPKKAFMVLVAEHDVVTQIIERPEIRAVTLTGSTQAGRAVAELCGRHLKKVVLELGGSDPYVILEDAHIKEAAATCVTSRLINSGQSCIAAKRFIVHQKVVEPFTAAVLRLLKTKTYGDPLTGKWDIGPMARKELRDDLHRQVQASVEAGAKLLLGGFVPEGPGSFYPPTLLTDVPLTAPAFCDELFGPVAAIFTAQSEAEAISLANQTSYGLGAAVFTANLARGEQIAARELQAGACAVNDMVRSDPRLPFGGIKDSGLGRELSRFGIREFVNVKSVWIK